jgi:hypothetical protein
VFAPDVNQPGGPWWIDALLNFTATNTTGEDVVEVTCSVCKTDINYWNETFPWLPRPSFIPDPGCFHYGKLLSPARAMEWVYVDSLRLRRSLNATAFDVEDGGAY